jgi:hypothetical protein
MFCGGGLKYVRLIIGGGFVALWRMSSGNWQIQFMPTRSDRRREPHILEVKSSSVRWLITQYQLAVPSC